METLLQDLRFGLRMLLRNPSFALIAIITLGIGIGANAALFSVINGVLLKSLPIKDADHVAFIWSNTARIPGNIPSSTLNYRDWKQMNHVFSGLAGRRPFVSNLSTGSDPERVTGERVTADYFTVLGVTPILGRDFQTGEDKIGGEPLVLLSKGLWERRFGGDRNIVGKVITLNGAKTTVVGVMPNDYRPNVEFWIPLPINYEGADRDFHDTTVLGRLAPGVTIAKAQAEMDTINNQLIKQYPDINTGWNLRVVPVHDSIVQNIKEVLLILFGAVCFVLLIACTNVANLMLARAASREREIAIRTALGAGRFRLIRQVLTESVLIAIAGGILGVFIAVWGTRFLISLNPQGIPLSGEVGLDFRVLGFTVVVSIISGMIFGIVPALQATKPDLNSTMKESGKSSTNARGGMIRNMLVVVEIALALVLLIGAGLLIKSFARLQDVDPGFNREKLLTFQVSLPAVHYTRPEQVTGFYKDTIQRVSTLPGVSSAAAISVAPLASQGPRYIFYTEGKPLPTASESPLASYRVVTPNYFETMGIPLVAGRTFTDADIRSSLQVIIVNKELANQMWPNENPIGKRMTVGVPLSLNDVTYQTVVGVVGDVKHTSLSGDTGMQMYQPFYQAPGLGMTLVLRGKLDPTNFLDSIRSTVRQIDPTLPLANVKTMDTIIYENVAPFRFNMFLLTLFAGVALVLTIIGVYGVMSYNVTQRTQEIGIRMALGAEPGEVRSMILKKGLILSLIGLAIGLVGSFAATWAMSSLLFGVSTTDPVTFVGVAIILTIVAMVACYIPARRATRVDPIIALRSE